MREAGVTFVDARRLLLVLARARQGRVRLRLARRDHGPAARRRHRRRPRHRHRLAAAWLSAAHPEILPVDRDGHTLWPGSRQAWCPSSPVYRELRAGPDRPQLAAALPRPPGPGACGTSPTSTPATTCPATATPAPPPSAAGCSGRYGDPRRPQRRLGHRVLEPALHRLGAGPAAAAHDDLRQPDARAGLPAVQLRRAARLLPRARRRSCSELSPGVPVTTNFMTLDPLPATSTTTSGRPSRTSSAPTTTSSTASSTPGPSCPSAATSPAASPAAGRGC